MDLLMKSVDYSARFTHANDIVPSLPPPFLGFYHFPREVWQVDLVSHGQVEAGPASRNNNASHMHMDFVLHPAGPPGEFTPQQHADDISDNTRFVCAKDGSAQEWNFEFRICDGSGEDPQCHDSLCYWTPCHSLQDHIYYLGKHMYHKVGEC